MASLALALSLSFSLSLRLSGPPTSPPTHARTAARRHAGQLPVQGVNVGKPQAAGQAAAPPAPRA